MGSSTDGLVSKFRAVRNDAIFLCLMAIVGAVIALGVGQYALVHTSTAQLNNYTDTLLKQAADVATVSIDTFSVVNQSQAAPCSDANLNEMRFLLFGRKELYDIGRMQDGKLLCTAAWGKLKTPLQLPPPQRQQANGDLLWRYVPSVIDSRMIMDMAAHGTTIVFTSPTIFEHYERFDPSFSALILTQDGKHIYRSLGKPHGLLERFRRGAPAWEPGPQLTTSACNRRVDVCVVTALSNVNILTRTPIVAPELGGIGALAAIAFGVMMIRQRRLQSVPAEQVRQAIADGRLAVVYQPLVRIADGCIVGAEALVRVSDEKGHPISTEIIISIAEEAGLIGSISRMVVSRSLSDMQERLVGADVFYISINVSVNDVIDPAFRQFLVQEADRLHIPHERIVLELTERSTTNEEKLLSGVAILRSLGYGLYIDDLGTGYSSLAYLSKLPITGIKVDKIFTQSIGKQAVSSTIVEKICSIADTLGVTVVIEGVETQEQVSYIQKLHPAAIGQGFFWSTPVSADQLLLKWNHLNAAS